MSLRKFFTLEQLNRFGVNSSSQPQDLFSGLASAPFAKGVTREVQKVPRTDLKPFLPAETFQLFLELPPEQHLRFFVSLLSPGQPRLEDDRQPRVNHRYFASGFGRSCPPTLCHVSTVSRRSVTKASRDCNCLTFSS